MLGSPDLEKAPRAVISVSQNVRPGVVIIITPNGELAYDGPPEGVPAAIMKADCSVLVHPHFKAQIDANAKKLEKARREDAKLSEKKARLAKEIGGGKP